jgi:uncharacterized protein YjbI with pentapeptide repeats
VPRERRRAGLDAELPEKARFPRVAELAGADLEFADLRGADLREANWQGASLRSAWLYGAELPRELAERARSLGAILTDRPQEPPTACPQGAKYCGQEPRCVSFRDQAEPGE